MGESNLPSPPFIEIDGISNFRDLGGYPISSTQSIRSSVIYRCAEPSQVTKNGIEAMQKLGINKVYDLRSNNEIERNKASGRGGVTEWDGCERLFVPVFKDEDYSPENLALRYADYTAEGTEVSCDRLFEAMTDE
jgi:protein tyrosine/serine phosphatase